MFQSRDFNCWVASRALSFWPKVEKAPGLVETEEISSRWPWPSLVRCRVEPMRSCQVFKRGYVPLSSSSGCPFQSQTVCVVSGLYWERLIRTRRCIRRHLGSIGRMMVGDDFFGRGCRQRGLGRVHSATTLRYKYLDVKQRSTHFQKSFRQMLSSENACGPCSAYGWFVTASRRSRVMETSSYVSSSPCSQTLLTEKSHMA